MYPNILHFGAWPQQGFSRTEESVIKVHHNSIMICCRSTTAGHHPEGTNLWKLNKRGSTGKEGVWGLDQLNLEGLDNWTEDQQGAAKALLVDSADVFSKDDLDLGKCNILKHDINITDPQPFKERYRRIPPHLYEEVKAHLQEMVEVGTIRRSFSPWASVVVLVRK